RLRSPPLHACLRSSPTRRSSDLETGLDQPLKDIVYVTNLDDSGEGSFREALSGGDRYVLFKVAGTITLHSPIQIRDNNIYIAGRSEEHTSELQSREKLVCRLLLE